MHFQTLLPGAASGLSAPLATTSALFRRALVLVATLASLCFAAASRADVVVSDASFAAGDWLATVYFTSGGNPTHGESAAPSGGNPGAFRSMTHQVPLSSSIGVFHEFLPFTYDPAVSGAIDSLTYREDRIEFSPPFAGAAIGANPALIQGGVTYFGSNITFTNTSWATVQLHGLTSLSFTSAINTHPDFTSSGGPIRFGFARSNTSTSSLGFGTFHGIDNWSFTLHGAAAVGVEGADPSALTELRIVGPNPTSERVGIRLSRSRAGRAVIAILDPSGRRIRMLADREFAPGPNELAWDGRDERGRRVRSGVYFVVVRANDEQQTAKVVIAN